MASWVAPGNYSAGHTITKPEWDQDVRDNTTYLYDALLSGGGGENPKELSIMAAQAPIAGLTAASIEVAQSSTDTISPQFYHLSFDGSSDEGRMWNFNVPSGYVDTPKLVVKFYLSSSDTAGNTVIFDAQVAAISSSDSGINTKVFDSANEGTTSIVGNAYVVEEQTITLTNDDSMTANDLVSLALWRHASTDSCNVDAHVNYVGFSYNV